jgi:hypothetical protein
VDETETGTVIPVVAGIPGAGGVVAGVVDVDVVVIVGVTITSGCGSVRDAAVASVVPVGIGRAGGIA